MEEIERKVAELYGGLWKEIETIRDPEIVSQFVFNVGLPVEWYQGKTCLDVGCGSGYAISCIEHLGGTCFACDLAQDNLVNVRRNLGTGSDGHLAVGSVLELPFPSNRFDFVYCNGVIHHTLAPRKGFEEILRVTRPGGTLFIGLYGKGGIYNFIVSIGRLLAPYFSFHLADGILDRLLEGRKVPTSFMPAKVSVLDNLYVPIRYTYCRNEIRQWFADAGVEKSAPVRTRTTIYDYRKAINRMIYGDAYLQFRTIKPEVEG